MLTSTKHSKRLWLKTIFFEYLRIDVNTCQTLGSNSMLFLRYIERGKRVLSLRGIMNPTETLK